MVAKLQGWPQLETQVLHDHVALEEQQSVPIYLLGEAKGDVGGKQTWQRSLDVKRCRLTCFLKTSEWGPRACGSASLMNQTTSSTDQVDGSLLGGALDSWDSDVALYPEMRVVNWKKSLGEIKLQNPLHVRKFAVFPTCPVALWEGIRAGRRLSAHTHWGWAVVKLLWCAKPVWGLWRVGWRNGAESRVAGIDGVAFPVRLVQMVIFRHGRFSWETGQESETAERIDSDCHSGLH